MFYKRFFFENFLKSKKFYKNLKKTKKCFKILKSDIKNFQIPPLTSYDENYDFDFNKKIIKKFSKFNNIILIGMGGSILGTQAIYSALKNKIKKEIFFFDNLDENLYFKFKKIKNLGNSCFVVVSKSGNTVETLINLGTIFSKKLLKNKLVIITEIKDSALMHLADKYNAEIIEHKNYIGGRYSVLSEVGMFPSALMGLNIKKFKNLNKLINNNNFVSALIKNSTCIYTLLVQGKNNSVILNYDSNLNSLGYWYQQLVGESLGKNGKGITPILSFCPKDHHSLLQLYLDGPKNKFFTFFTTSKNKFKNKITRGIVPKNMKFIENKNLNLILNAQSKATKKIFKLKKIPFREFIFNKKDEKELGNIFTFFAIETILLARMMNVNPFDQPAVEQVKTETKKILLS